MIKRLIFDIDNTLIIYNDNIFESLTSTLNELDIFDENLFEAIQKSMWYYENNNNFYSEKNIMNHLNNFSNLNLPDEFITIWLKYLGQIEPYDLKHNEEAKQTLEYLKNKYELVVLTNWFTSSQSERLKLAGLYDYFIEIIGTDKILNKPNKEAFIGACGNRKIQECIMIGDNLIKDIEGASNIGMETILCDYKNNNKIYSKRKINKITELKEML